MFCHQFVVGKMHWYMIASCSDDYIVNKWEKREFIIIVFFTKVFSNLKAD